MPRVAVCTLVFVMGSGYVDGRAETLGEQTFTHYAGTCPEVVDFFLLTLTLTEVEWGPPIAPLHPAVDLPLDEQDTGASLVISSETNVDFAAIAAALTNGSNLERIQKRIEFPGAGGIIDNFEPLDIPGAQLERLIVTFDEIQVLQHCPDDPNAPGTIATLTARITYEGQSAVAAESMSWSGIKQFYR